MKSALYPGTVVHTRRGPVRHRFRYSLPWFLVDLDETESLRFGHLFNVNRSALVSFYDSDHGARDGSSFRDWLTAKLIAEGVPDELLRVATERSQEISVAYQVLQKGMKVNMTILELDTALPQLLLDSEWQLEEI
mgnify:CR=1 FL=1